MKESLRIIIIFIKKFSVKYPIITQPVIFFKLLESTISLKNNKEYPETIIVDSFICSILF